MTSKFSKDGKYFAQFTSDGKLRIWDTITNSFEQEFTPDFHLTSPCTCLHFVHNDIDNNKVGSPRKKKRRSSINTVPSIVLGTSSGILLVYSIAKADLEFTINSETSLEINCLSICDDATVFSGADQNIIVWNLLERKVTSKWSAGKERITAILTIPQSNKLLTGSKIIKLWDLDTKEVLKTFTGHSSNVTLLEFVDPKGSNSINDCYFLSGSKQDRILSCWSLNEKFDNKTAVVNYLLNDIVQNVSINVMDGRTNIAATIRSGVVHIYQHTLNGHCGKPIKPKTTIQIAADNDDQEKQQDNEIKPIQIIGSYYKDEKTLLLAYGTIVTAFENIEISLSKRSQCLLRKDPKLNKQAKEKQNTKTVTPIVGNNVNYVTPLNATSASTTKRRVDGKQEIPMEKRLENLQLNKLDNNKVPKTDNLAQLLVQGLHSKDETIIKTVLLKQDEQIIKNTIKRLPMPVIVPLIEEITKFIQGKTTKAHCGVMWMKNLILIHASLLIANPDLYNLVGPILGCIETRLGLQTPLNRLKGRLNLLSAQINNETSQENNDNENALIVFNDRDSSDSDNEEMELDFHSESENEWLEDEEQDDSGDEGENTENNQNEEESDDDDDDMEASDADGISS